MPSTKPAVIAGRPWLAPVWIDPDSDRTEWLLARLSGYGGSDVAAIVGESPWKSAVQVWTERVTGAVDESDIERAAVGRMLEEPILGWYAAGAPRWPRDEHPYRVVKPPTVYHRDRPWHRGSADGLVYVPEVVAHLGEGADLLAAAPATALDHLVEIKTHGWFAGREYSRDDVDDETRVPSDKRIQCAWYMSLYDVDTCRLLVLTDTHHRRTYTLHRDREIEATLLEEVDTFHRRFVLTGTPPPADGSRHYSEWLRKRYDSHDDEMIESTPEVDAAIRDLAQAKAARKELDRIEEAAEQTVKAHIGARLGVASSVCRVTWKSQRSGRLREKEARLELYQRAGMTDDEILAFEEKHYAGDVRVLRLHTTSKRGKS